MIAAADMRQSTGDYAFIQLFAPGNAQARVIQEGALAALGNVELVVGRVIDHACDDHALALQGNRDRELRNAVQKVRGAVQGSTIHVLDLSVPSRVPPSSPRKP